jgi:hypothetical protein
MVTQSNEVSGIETKAKTGRRIGVEKEKQKPSKLQDDLRWRGNQGCSITSV